MPNRRWAARVFELAPEPRLKTAAVIVARKIAKEKLVQPARWIWAGVSLGAEAILLRRSPGTRLVWF